MPAIDPESLLASIAPDAPSGPSLEGDASYQELERLAQGKPERQIGNTVVPAEEPDWKSVERLAAPLLVRSKDLRIGIHLTKALLRTQGWSGLAAGLAVLRGLLETFWADLHPRLDHESDDDPTERGSALLNLTEPALIGAIRATPLITSRVFGKIALRDVELATGEGASAGGNGEPHSTSTVDAAVAEVDFDVLSETAKAVRSTVEALVGIEAAFTAHVRAGEAPNLAPIAAVLRKARAFVDGKVAQREPHGAANGSETSASNGPSNGSASAHVAASAGAPGEIVSRDDVIRALDKISAYYARFEPSSPVPVLIERSKRLVSMSFIEIIRDLVPDGVSQVEVLRGRSE